MPLGLAALSEVEISPNPFTPNGDGINDAARIGLSVFKITAGRELGVSIHSLDGRRVWEARQVVSGGAHTIQWPGVDDAGRSVPPGMYICRHRARRRFQGSGRGRGGPPHFGCLLRDLNIWEGVVRKTGRQAATILVAVALAATTSSAVAQEYGSRLGNIRRGGEVSFDPRGPGVLFGALDPAMKKWYVPQELYAEYAWRQWEYSNYARGHFARYVDIALEGDYYYDLYGNFVTHGWLIFNNSQSQPQQFGSSVLKANRFDGWFSGAVISADAKGQYQ